MEFVDIITNTGLDPINRNILDSLNYEELKQLCQTSKEIEDYIKKNSLKWKLLEKLQERKHVIKSLGYPSDNGMDQEGYFWVIEHETPIINLFGRENFEYFEKHGNNEQLALFLDFTQAYLDEEETLYLEEDTLQWAVMHKRTDFVNLMIPTPLLFDMPEEYEPYERNPYHQWLMPLAISTGNIEMVKLLLKYSEEKRVNLEPWNCEMGEKEDIVEIATRLGHYKIAQLIQGVLEGKIDKKDLQPVIRRFK